MINKETIRKNFSNYAERYDEYSNIQDLCGMKLIDSIKSEGIRDIIDVGCGTGTFTSLLKAKFPIAEIKAVDISSEMIQIAESKCGCQGIDFIVSDAEQLSLEPSFNLISSNVSFQWFENLEKTLFLYKKSLKKGGTIAFSIFGPRTFFELNSCLKQLHPANTAITSASFISKDKITKILKNLFKRVDVREQIIQEEVNSLPEFLRKIKYTGTRGAGIRKKGFWTPGMIDKLEQMYRKEFGTIIVTYQFFLAQAIKGNDDY